MYLDHDTKTASGRGRYRGCDGWFRGAGRCWRVGVDHPRSAAFATRRRPDDRGGVHDPPTRQDPGNRSGHGDSRGRDTVRGPGTTPWLLRIVANQARNHRRSSGRRVRANERVASRRSAPDLDPADAAVLSAEQARLYAALGRLAQTDREVLACRFLAQLSEGETAAALQLRPGTVKSRTHRALERLRAEVEGG